MRDGAAGMPRYRSARRREQATSGETSHIVVHVLLNSNGFKGVRFRDTLYALELGASLLRAMHALFPRLFAIYAGKVTDRYGLSPVFRANPLFSASGRSGRGGRAA